jgi:hypothetical protein
MTFPVGRGNRFIPGKTPDVVKKQYPYGRDWIGKNPCLRGQTKVKPVDRQIVPLRYKVPGWVVA